MNSKREKQRTAALIARAGGPAVVARMFTPPITMQAVSQWIQVPADRCREIERGSGGAVTRYELRPDIFGESAAAA